MPKESSPLSPIPLRAHHALCLQFFEGRGYSQSFVDHLQQTLDLFRAGHPIVLVEGCDHICQCCPCLKEGRCTTEEKVTRYDRQIAQLCGFRIGSVTDFEAITRSVSTHLLNTPLFSTLCPDCEWRAICHKEAR